jgi:peptide/nickel transport system substrate-binding protein
MAALQDRADYGRVSPVGTGVLRVVEMDKNKGLTVERWAQYNTQPENKKGNVDRWRGIPIPDSQTQSAQLLVGGVDLLLAVPPDQANALATNPGIQITYVPSPTLIYLAIDSVNLSGNKALSDPRVRKAIFMGVDRAEIIKYLVPGGQVAEHVQGACFKTTIACSYSVMPPSYDPAAAKKLLAEAGYPDGLDVNYLVRAPVKAIGEAVAGQLLKIGVRMKVQVADVSLYRRQQGDGKLEAWTAIFPTGSYPDAGNISSVLFTGPAMQYYNDSTIADAMEKGEAEVDSEKRTGIYKKAFDRINEMHYLLPLTSMPTVNVHSKDVRVGRNAVSAGDAYVINYGWN